jgi:hypothetical protein
MGSSKTLGKYLTAQHQQRLSIAEIHRLWNAELHQAEGRTPYASSHPNSTPQSGEVSPDPADIFKAFNELTKIGKWHDAAGNIVSDDQIDWDLAELIQKGELRTYPGKDPSINPIPVKDIQGINIRPKTRSYFVDRDELGLFLFRQGHPLPKFWYEAQDENIYQDQLAKQNDSVREMREHLKLVISENEHLRQDLLKARPFMDPEHPFFAPELEAAVAVWLEMYDHRNKGDIVAGKPTMESWLKANRATELGIQVKSIRKAIDRIIIVANYNKTPGRPRTRKII